MAFFTQNRFPQLFHLFQIWLGGTLDKQKLTRLKYQNQKRILEVGCSIGNIAHTFRHMPQVEYIGIDIDPVVIQFAQQAFSDLPNFYFVCGDLTELQMPAKKFDFILFAGVCHHIDDKLCKKILQTAQNLLSENGSLVVIDILQPEPEDSWLVRQYIKIDQGEHIRSDAELRALLQSVSALNETEIHYVSSSPYSFPIIARFGIYTFA